MIMWLAAPQQGIAPRLLTLKEIEAFTTERYNLATVVRQDEPGECGSRRLTLQLRSETPAYISSASPHAVNYAVLCQSWRIRTIQFRVSIEEAPDVTSKDQGGRRSVRIGKNQYCPLTACITLRQPIRKVNHS